ncbi:MAG TPA: tetratricopeptide repeat protein, partial [Gemmatimonadaceae bacterium]
MSPQNNPGAVTSLNGVRPVLAHFDTPRSAEDLAADIIDLWAGAEGSLQSLVGNSSLTGQQLIRAARQAEVITLEQAHALLEFLAARDRANRTSYKPTQADGDAAVDGFRALESAVTGAAPATRAAPTNPPQAAYTPRQSRPVQSTPPPPPPTQPSSPYAPPSPGVGGYRQPPAYAGRKLAGPPTIELPRSFTSEGAPGGSSTPAGSGGVGRTHVEHALAAAERRRWPQLSTPIWIAVAVVVLVLLGGGYLLFGRGGGEDNMTAGIDAMKNGQLERARGEFAKAVKADPNAATPHVFLARLAREQGDLATARAELDTALRVEPRNAIALREMGLVLFASRQYDLARRFFIRAVQANPQDRAAQGYLGCALMRAGRVT